MYATLKSLNSLPQFACRRLHRNGGCLPCQPARCVPVIACCCRLHNLCIQRPLPLLEAPIVEDRDNGPANVDVTGAAHKQRLCELFFNMLTSELWCKLFKSAGAITVLYCLSYVFFLYINLLAAIATLYFNNITKICSAFRFMDSNCIK